MVFSYLVIIKSIDTHPTKLNARIALVALCSEIYFFEIIDSRFDVEWVVNRVFTTRTKNLFLQFRFQNGDHVLHGSFKILKCHHQQNLDML